MYVRLYFNEMERVGMLSAGEESELAGKIRSGDQAGYFARQREPRADDTSAFEPVNSNYKDQGSKAKLLQLLEPEPSLEEVAEDTSPIGLMIKSAMHFEPPAWLSKPYIEGPLRPITFLLLPAVTLKMLILAFA